MSFNPIIGDREKSCRIAIIKFSRSTARSNHHSLNCNIFHSITLFSSLEMLRNGIDSANWRPFCNYNLWPTLSAFFIINQLFGKFYSSTTFLWSFHLKISKEIMRKKWRWPVIMKMENLIQQQFCFNTLNFRLMTFPYKRGIRGRESTGKQN